MALGLITEQDLYTALSLQNNLPLGKPENEAISVPVTRALPAAWRVSGACCRSASPRANSRGGVGICGRKRCSPISGGSALSNCGST